MTIDPRLRPRRLLRLLHRDIGYLLFAITALYSISGFAVNHIHDWNPNYGLTRQDVSIGPLEAADADGLEAEVVSRLGLDPAEITGRHRPAPGQFTVFLEGGGEARLDVATGTGRLERYQTRPLLFEANVLHLNRIRGAWTYVADGFAVLLLFLAASGLFMLKGRTGLGGRGKWLVAAGVLVPVVFLVLSGRGH